VEHTQLNACIEPNRDRACIPEYTVLCHEPEKHDAPFFTSSFSSAAHQQ
jgi:hypothetical protein